MTPEISVIVPVRDGEDSLPALLGSLSAQTIAPERYEVIVVDNASRDATAEVARGAGAVVVHEPVPNRSRARNAGAAAARSDLFAFTDADCVAEPAWLESHLGCAGRAPLVAGPVNVTTGASPNSVERFEALWRFAQESWVEQGWAATANLCVERRAFEAVGGLEPAYRHIGEDADFCIRAGRAGFELGYCREAAVTHAAESELSPMLRRAFFHGYSAHQCAVRVGVGHRASRDPRPLMSGAAAMRLLGWSAEQLEPGEWRAMRRLARLAYCARVAGSAWATLRRVS